MRPVAMLALVISACDAQADAGYSGEPLVTLQGIVVSSQPQLPPLEAAMLWQRGPPPSTDDMELATRAPVQTGFPTTFTVHLYQPAPAGALRSLAIGEPQFARANAGAVPPGVAIAAGPLGAAAGNGSYGIDANHWVLYLVADVPKGSITEWWLGAPLGAGFHLLRVTAVNPQCVTPDQLQKCEADLAARGASSGAARAFCLQPYQLSLAPPSDQIILDLGTVGLGPGGACP
jgi:hypothetical protein